jgi:hypothetical protein
MLSRRETDVNVNTFLQNARNRRDEMTRDLYVRYPRLLRPGSVRQPLAYGPGWFRLVDEFFAGVNDLLSDDLATRFCVDQIKEKFGGMKIHYAVLPRPAAGTENDAAKRAVDESLDFPTAEINALKWDVEKRSESTCFFCGAPGTKRQAFWMRVSCDACEARVEPGP